MKSYAVLFIFAALVVGGLGWYAAEQDWSKPNYAASSDSSIVVENRSISCGELLQRTCDLTDDRVLREAQPNVDVFLNSDNVAQLASDQRISTVDTLRYGVEICGNRFWKESSAVFADKQPDLEYYAAFIVWSNATKTLCPSQM